MTLHATRKGDDVTVHFTYGSVTAAITEQAGHVTHFHRQLGALLADVQGYGAARAADGYERYRRHAGGVSKFTGDALPAWEDQDEEVKGHWIAAFTG